MENPIKKHIDYLCKIETKKAYLEVGSVAGLSVNQKKEIRDKVAINFTLINWVYHIFEFSDFSRCDKFIPPNVNIALFDFLSISIGYGRTVKQAFDDDFPLLREYLKDIDRKYVDIYREKITCISPEIIQIYVFFRNEIEKSCKENIDVNKLIIEKITDLSKKAKNASRTSHPSKFSHPDLKFPKIDSTSEASPDGFVRTGNAVVDFDMHLNASILPVFKFLSLRIDQSQILDLFTDSNSEKIMSMFDVELGTYEKWRSRFLACLKTENTNSDHRVKQIYFPVEGSYHQLSVLFPSGLVFKLKEKIDYINTRSIDAYQGKIRKKKSEYYPQGYSSIFDLTHQRFGGDHPKNISGLNNKHQNVYLLRSMPPKLTSRTIQPPRRNFFSDTLWAKAYQDDFESLHKLFIAEANNIHIRKQRDRLCRQLIYQVVDRLWLVRRLAPGWSHSDHYQQLPPHQKVWLDQGFLQSREADTDWLDAIKNDFSRWFSNTYTTLLGKKALSIGDEQWPYFKSMLDDCEEALR